MKTLAIFCLTFFLSLSYQPFVENDQDDCTYKGISMMGRIRIVDHGEDVKIRVVDRGEDVKIRLVERPALYCYEWRIVEHGEDLRVRIVDHGEDMKIRFVDYTP
jgi:hypothetical protein